MAENTKLRVNNNEHNVSSAPDTPLLYVLRDELGIKGPRFGCGLAQCGSCSVLVDGLEIRACITPISSIEGKSITTLEGLPEYYAASKNTDVPEMIPLQEAMIEEQAIQCGYCYNGMLIKATELLQNNQSPSEQEIKSAMNGHLCRCGTYPRIIAAIQKAAAKMEADV